MRGRTGEGAGLSVPTIRDLPAPWPIRAADGILNLVFPDSCLICSAPVSRMRECGVCAACWRKALELRLLPPWCPSCGLPFPAPGAGDLELCGSCSIDPPPYSGARSFGYYSSELRCMVQALKFDGRKTLVSLLAPMLLAQFSGSWPRDAFELIVPVPLHRRRLRERGYNQSALLAARLSQSLILPWSGDALMRLRHTPPQVGLTDAQRAENVRAAFQCRDAGAVRDKRILLIDDVMTTGATAGSASLALLKAGARSVSVLTVARSVPGIG